MVEISMPPTSVLDDSNVIALVRVGLNDDGDTEYVTVTDVNGGTSWAACSIGTAAMAERRPDGARVRSSGVCGGSRISPRSGRNGRAYVQGSDDRRVDVRRKSLTMVEAAVAVGGRDERPWKARHDTVTRNRRCFSMPELCQSVARFLEVEQPFPGNGHGVARLESSIWVGREPSARSRIAARISSAVENPVDVFDRPVGVPHAPVSRIGAEETAWGHPLFDSLERIFREVWK